MVAKNKKASKVSAPVIENPNAGRKGYTRDGYPIVWLRSMTKGQARRKLEKLVKAGKPIVVNPVPPAPKAPPMVPTPKAPEPVQPKGEDFRPLSFSLFPGHNLLIDNVRNFPVNMIARTAQDAIMALQNCGPWDTVFINHDLGPDGRSGLDVLLWLEKNQEFLPAKLEVISTNLTGIAKLREVAQRLYDRKVEDNIFFRPIVMLRKQPGERVYVPHHPVPAAV